MKDLTNMAAGATRFPSLPLVCLQTAKDTNTIDIIKGENTVIGKVARKHPK